VEIQEMIRDLLTTESSVFSIFITARRDTGVERFEDQALTASEAARQEEESGSALVRTVRMVVWRRSGAEAIELLPIIPWEILDYVPYEVLDFPDEDR
jgi:chorismate-pyruvate lyase